MISQEHALRALFHELVDNCYRGDLRVDDAEISSYMGDLLTDFSESEKIYAIRDSIGRPVKELSAMLEAADPIHGSAPSFDAERQARKHIGDYALFFTGMYPESMHPILQPQSFTRLIETGKESYAIVASFDLFEYAREAPLFERLAAQFETCVAGLNLVRAELDKRRALPFSPKPQKHLM